MNYYLLALILSISLSTLIFWIIYQRIKKLNAKEKALILKQQAFYTHMSPHFIFNSLNSIQAFLIYEETEKAENFLVKFSKLLREELEMSNLEEVDLQREIDVLEKYLEIEQIRFDHKFDWSIKVQQPSSLHTYNIPNLLIIPYLESCIKNSFVEKTKAYKLDIEFTVKDDFTLICRITDNGIDRFGVGDSLGTRRDIANHLSGGEKITYDRLGGFSKNQHYGVTFASKELSDGNNNTIVELLIPIMNPN